MKIPDNINEIAKIIETHWHGVSSHARPYLNAMYYLNTMHDKFLSTSAHTIVSGFLGTAKSWTGPMATPVKEKLNQLLRENQPAPDQELRADRSPVLHSQRIGQVDVYGALPIGGGYFYGTDSEGWGRVFRADGFYGIAQPKTLIGATEFVVRIFGTLVPLGRFRPRTYRDQKDANKALVKYAQKAISELPAVTTDPE